MKDSPKDTLTRRHEAGVAIKKKLGCSQRFGSKPKVPAAKRHELMEEHDLSSDQFYKALDFAFLYTQKEFNALRKRRNAESGESLGWTHLRALLTFSRDELPQREELEIAAVDEGWSARRLWEEAKKARGGPKKAVGGPRFKYEDLLRWASETHRYLAGLFEEEEDPDESKRLVVDRVLRESRQDRGELRELSRLTAEISEKSQALAERSRKQRRSRRT